MTEKEFVKAVAAKTSYTIKDTEKVIEAAKEALQEALVAGEEIRLTNFGIFSVSEMAERSGVNPRTGERLVVPAHGRVKFTAGKRLKDAIN